jgi:N-acyl-D-aspartate/D-glutamate deacylase
VIGLSFDLIIKNGRIIDGAGNPWYKGDVAIADGKIVTIGKSLKAEAKEAIDATGLIVAPGFIDAHSHSDSATLFYRQMESTIMQGITTVVAGQCGLSIAPINPEYVEVLEKRYAEWLPPEVEFKITWSTFDEYLKEEEKDGLGANVAHMVGHSAARAVDRGKYNGALAGKTLRRGLA